MGTGANGYSGLAAFSATPAASAFQARRVCQTELATSAGTPGTAAISSSEAALRRLSEPKWRMIWRLRLGPTPGTSSSTETVIARSLSSRWNVTAKRWDSSLTCLMR